MNVFQRRPNRGCKVTEASVVQVPSTGRGKGRGAPDRMRSGVARAKKPPVAFDTDFCHLTTPKNLASRHDLPVNEAHRVGFVTDYNRHWCHDGSDRVKGDAADD